MDCQFCGSTILEGELQENIECFSEEDADGAAFILDQYTRVAKCDNCGTMTQLESESDEEGGLAI